jgi:hypothetical protein
MSSTSRPPVSMEGQPLASPPHRIRNPNTGVLHNEDSPIFLANVASCLGLDYSAPDSSRLCSGLAPLCSDFSPSMTRISHPNDSIVSALLWTALHCTWRTSPPGSSQRLPDKPDRRTEEWEGSVGKGLVDRQREEGGGRRRRRKRGGSRKGKRSIHQLAGGG